MGPETMYACMYCALGGPEKATWGIIIGCPCWGPPCGREGFTM